MVMQNEATNLKLGEFRLYTSVVLLGLITLTLSHKVTSRPSAATLGQSCKKIIDLDRKDRDHLIDLDLLGNLDHCW